MFLYAFEFCSFSLTAGQKENIFTKDLPTGSYAPGLAVKPNLEVCFSVLNLCYVPLDLGETGRHGNGLSLQVVCNGMRSLWAQFCVCMCAHGCVCLCVCVCGIPAFFFFPAFSTQKYFL